MSSTDGEIRALRADLDRQKWRWIWTTVCESLATAILGPIAIAVFIAEALTVNNPMIASALAFSAGSSAYLTWKGTRYAKRLKAMADTFNETVEELRKISMQQYERGREDAKEATAVLIREVAQSFANASGSVFEMMFEGEHIVCHPQGEQRWKSVGPPPPAPRQH